MKKLLIVFILSLLSLFAKEVSAQAYFTDGFLMAGSPAYISVKDVQIHGTATQGSSAGSFYFDNLGNTFVGGVDVLLAYSSYNIDPPSFFNPLILHSSPSSASTITFINTATTPKSVTIEQYYSGALIQSQTTNVIASTGTAGYAIHLVDAAKTYTSRAPLDWGGQFPQPGGSYSAYYVRVVVN